MKLTPYGKAFSVGCKAIVDQYQELEASIRHERDRLPAHVRVAAIYSVGLGDMGEYVERFSAEYPQVKVHIEYLHPDDVYKKVVEGAVDFGLVSFPRGSRELAVLPWREEEMVVACSPTHSLAGHAVIRPTQLNGQNYIGFIKDLRIRKEVDGYLRRNKITVEAGPAFDTVENIKHAVQNLAGVAVLPEPTLRREVEAGTLVARPLSGRRFVRPLGIIYRRQNKPGAMALRFMQLLRHPHTVSPLAPASGTVTLPRVNGASRRRNGRASTRTI
jgi:DNA-binding transcriptional LysR family regulator